MTPPTNVKLRSSGLSVTVDTLGAQLRSIQTASGQELLWQGDPASWPDRALILFPLIGPLIDNQLHHDGQTYAMPPHGFARSRQFSVVEQTESRAVLELCDDAETHAQYPFPFVFRVAFEVDDNRLLNTISVRNPGNETLPADIGFHPGFRWPLTPGRPKEDYALIFEQVEPAPIRRGTGDPVFLYPEGRPSPVEGKVLRLRDELFDDLAIVFDRLNSRSLTFTAPESLGLKIDFPDSPNLGVWMIPGAEFVAIEPWHGYPSQLDFHGPFAEKPGIAHIAPGETRRWRLGLTLIPAG